MNKSPLSQEEQAKNRLRECVRAWKQRREDRMNGKRPSEKNLFYLRPKPWAHVCEDLHDVEGDLNPMYTRPSRCNSYISTYEKSIDDPDRLNVEEEIEHMGISYEHLS